VSWDGTLSDLIAVRYGVRQGSILGPVLFLVLISDIANAQGIGNNENIVYADNTTIWQAGKTVAEVVDKLTGKAERFAEWSRGSGPTMNASKTQLLLTANAGSCSACSGSVAALGDSDPGSIFFTRRSAIFHTDLTEKLLSVSSPTPSQVSRCGIPLLALLQFF
jgi:hypothetical protein